MYKSGEDLRFWRIFHGTFDAEATRLKTSYPGQIELKRTARITVAIPEQVIDINGLSVPVSQPNNTLNCRFISMQTSTLLLTASAFSLT